MEDEDINETADNALEHDPQVETYSTFGPTAEERLRQIGESAVFATIPGVTPDRTGEVIDKIHAALGDKHRSLVVAMSEPGTGVQGLVVLKPSGGIETVPSDVFDEYRSRPKAYTGTANVTRIESFVDHANRFKDDHSALYAFDDMSCPRLTAVLDYNESRADPEDPFNGPRFGDHCTVFAFPLSDEWKAWTGKNAAKMGLTAFAEFIEDRFIDVEQVTDVTKLNGDIQKLVGTVGPGSLASPSALIELSRGLKVHVKDEVTNAANIASGEVEVQFKSEHQDGRGNKLTVPSLFVLNIPVFARGEVYRIAARLRYRVKDGEMLFWYELWGIDRVFELAFTEVCEKARAETGLPLFYGTPE